MKRLLSVIIVIAMASSLSAPAFAVDITWDGDQNNGTWSDGLNWALGVAPGVNDNALFVDGGGTVDTINVTGASVGTIYFQTGACVAYTIGSAADQLLTLQNGGGLNMAAAVTQTQLIVADLGLSAAGSNASLENNAGDAADIMNITGDIIGSGIAGDITLKGTNTGDNVISGAITTGAASLGVIKNEGGKWILSGANDYTGATAVNAGVLNIQNNTATGSVVGGVTVANGAALQIQGTIAVGAEALSLTGTGVGATGALRNILNDNSWAGAITLAGATRINSDAGTLTLGAGGITGAGQDLTVGGAGNTAITGVIGTTTGSLTKDEAGALTLSGANSYSGGTTLTLGTLNINNATALGTGTFVITTGTLDNTSAADVTLTTGGAQTWNGNFAYTGGTHSLNLGTGTVTLGATPTITVNGNTLTVGGVISGAQGITKAGVGTLTLSGANTYTGKTSIQAGTLSAASLGDVGGAASSLGIPGNVANGTIALGSVANTGQLTYTGAGETTDRVIDLAGTTGGGTIDQSGTGALEFTSANTATGGGAKTLTLQGSTAGTGQISGVIVDSTAATSVTKTGTGTWTLSGVNTYTGLTTITTGTLRAGNAKAFGTGAVTNNATLSVDTTSLSITGVYTQNALSTLTLTANSATSYGNITSPAAAVVNAGSTVAVTVGGYMANGATLTIIDAAAGATVNVPTTITSSNSKYTFAGSVVNGDLILTVNRGASGGGGFAGDATSGDSNASAIGTVLDNVTSPSTDMTAVLNTMDGLSASQVASALDTMVPEVDAGVINTSTTVMNNFVGVAMDRVEQTLKVAKAADSAASGISAGEASKLNGIWGKGYGSYLTQGTRNGIAGYDAWNAGTALGVDRLFADCATVGISGGYAYGNVDSDVNNANTYINSAQTTVYGGYEDPNLPFFVDAAGSFAWNWYQGRRDINVGNVILRTANASYDGQQYGAYIGGGYRFDMTKIVEFTPLLSLQYNHLQLQSYTETEAGALGLSVASQGYDQLQSGLGARVAAPIKYEWGTFIPEVHGKWFYDFIGDAMVVGSNFTGGGASFNSNGVKPALNSFNVGGELTFDLKNDISVIAACDTEVKDEFFGIYGTATVRYEF